MLRKEYALFKTETKEKLFCLKHLKKEKNIKNRILVRGERGASTWTIGGDELTTAIRTRKQSCFYTWYANQQGRTSIECLLRVGDEQVSEWRASSSRWRRTGASSAGESFCEKCRTFWGGGVFVQP